MNLYTMAGALRTHKPIPKYLPSAAVARKQLLDHMEEAELETEEERVQSRPWQTGEKHRRWADVYRELLPIHLFHNNMISGAKAESRCYRVCIFFCID